MVDQEDLNNLIRGERTFLHDASNPLAIAYGNIRLLVIKLEKDPTCMDIPAILEKLNKSLKSFDKVNTLLEERRNYIKSRQG